MYPALCRRFFRRASLLIGLWPIALRATIAPDGAGSTNWVFLDNGQIRLGVKTTSGAAIGWLSASGATRNLLNHFDHGRLVQQSYYGNADGSLWAKKPWRWNPVQGGDYQGRAATLLELKAEPAKLYAKTRPRHWASGADLPDVTMEEWITLTGRVARVRFRFSYSGHDRHVARDHEIPAFFAEPDLATLVLYDGDHPWTGAAPNRSQPGWPNEARRMTEHWAAYVGTNNFGVGAYVPLATNLTCYRFAAGHPAKQGACSYFAPVTKFAITPGLVFAYDLYLTVGTAEEMRETFRKIHDVNGAE